MAKLGSQYSLKRSLKSRIQADATSPEVAFARLTRAEIGQAGGVDDDRICLAQGVPGGGVEE